MYQRILVPLDGSKLAECVLPHVEEIAKGCHAKEVVLVSVTERIVGYSPSLESQRFESLGQLLSPEPVGKIPLAVGKKQRQAQRYLGRIGKRLEAKGIPVRCEVLLGNPAEQISSYAQDSAADLIVMASHGRSGPSKWAYGSVADKVFRASCVPILMVRAPGCLPGL
jgi:nucleotide-binding universal stress UspA family protein